MYLLSRPTTLSTSLSLHAVSGCRDFLRRHSALFRVSCKVQLAAFQRYHHTLLSSEVPTN